MKRARALLLVLSLLPAAPSARAQSVCYYNRRERVVTTVTPFCKDGQMVFRGSVEAIYDVSCGIANTFNLFGDLCANPCASALKGIKNYPRTKGKIVVFGPALLALGGNNSKWAFAAYEGSCSDLRQSLDDKSAKGLEAISDDDLIKAAEDKKE